jgi:hypothetical protein
MLRWLFGKSSDPNNEASDSNKSNVVGIGTTTEVSASAVASCREFLKGLDLVLRGSSIPLRVWIRSNVPPSQLTFYEDDKFDGLRDVDIKYVMKRPDLVKERYFTDAVDSVVTALTSAIEEVPEKYQKRGYEYNIYADAAVVLKPAVKRFGIRKILEKTFNDDLESYFATEVRKAWDFETKYLIQLLEERKTFLKPLIIKAKRKMIDEFGNVKKFNMYRDNPLAKLMFDFLYSSVPWREEGFGKKFKLFAKDGGFNHYDAVPFCIGYTEQWFTDLDADSAVPQDGIDFEYWCAAKLKKAGWTAVVSKASGDQGSDILASKGDKVVCIQCKRYSKPVGNTAVQEVVAAKVHNGATHSCVLATGGFTKSAKELASSTQTALIDAENIKDFDEYF